MSQQSLRIMDGRLASLHHSTRRRRMARSRRSLPQTGFSTPLKIISQTVVSLRPMGGSLRSLHRITPSRREKARRRRIPPPTGVNPLLSKVPQVGGVKRQTRLNSRTRHTNHRLEREKCQSNVITIHTRSQGLKPLFTRPRIAQQKVGAIIPTHRAREAAKIGPIKKLQKRSKEQSTRREDQKVKDGIMPMIKGLLLQMNHLRSNQSLNSNQKSFSHSNKTTVNRPWEEVPVVGVSQTQQPLTHGVQEQTQIMMALQTDTRSRSKTNSKARQRAPHLQILLPPLIMDGELHQPKQP
mmetsp:Transcript_6412/g.8427  ORF Transcript_6412/g.8427 Transcript_6412/m.8427 type:complete len:296 (+) Transcript_6412:4349-5236(+)